MSEYTVMHDGDFEWVEHGPETLYAEDCANKLNQLQATNNQLLEALERLNRATNPLAPQPSNAIATARIHAQSVITNAKGE